MNYTYELCKRLIELQAFPKPDMKDKLDVYFANGRLTAEQYHELLEMIGD